MRELTLIVQTSLDGYVAGSKGEFDNFLGGEENLAFVCSLIDEADAILLGRVSYQLLNEHWPTAATIAGATENEIKYSNWYNAVPKYVLSATMKDKPANTMIIPGNIESAISAIKQQSGKNILLFGSPTATGSLFRLNLVDSFWIIVHPVFFGKGIPFFREQDNVVQLTLQGSKQLPNGTLCNKYVLNK